MSKNLKTHFLEFESPLPHTKKPLKAAPVAAFIKSKNYCTKTAPTMSQYRQPRLVSSGRGYYIEYYYRIPVALQQMFGGKIWERFKVKEDMNRRKGEDKERYAKWLLEEITKSLADGYNPFAEITIESTTEVNQYVTCQDAFNQFLEAWGKRGLEPVSLAKYKKCVNKLAAWLHNHKMLHGDIKSITTNHIETFLQDGKFSNREYNNTFDFVRTCFNYLVKKEIISKSPCAGVDKLKTSSSVHRYFDKKALDDITKALLVADPYTYLAFQTVYYLCIRSDKELMHLKCGNIKWDENKIMLDAGGTKGKSGAYIPMDDNIKALFIQNGIDKAPGNYYVFGIKEKPAEQHFGTGFFSKRFRKVRDAAGLSPDFTIYGAKHTRVIHLKQDGLSDADIMSLTRHKDFVAYAKYLKDLGMAADSEKINKVSRKV